MRDRAPGQAVVNGIGLPGHSGKRRGTGHFPVAGEPFYLTMVSQGEIVFQGEYAQPGPGEFIIETFAAWPLVGSPDFFSFFRQ